MKKHLVAIAVCLTLPLVSAQADTASSKIDDELINANELLDLRESAKAKSAFRILLKKDKNNAQHWTGAIRAAAQLGEWDDAEDLMDDAIEKFSNNAEVQGLAGRIYGQLAQRASIFSAMGYAKKSLKASTKAVELEPNNPDYRINLFNFHLHAPSIAGGDKDVALAQIDKISELDAAKGYILALRFHLVEDNKAKLGELIANVPEALNSDADVIFNRAMTLQELEKYEQSIAQLQRVVELTAGQKDKRSLMLSSLYQIGKSSLLGKTSLKKGVESLTKYINTSDKEKSLPSNDWANFRMAGLLALSGEDEKAMSMMRKIRESSNDKELIREIKKVL